MTWKLLKNQVHIGTYPTADRAKEVACQSRRNSTGYDQSARFTIYAPDGKHYASSVTYSGWRMRWFYY